jgi:Zn ribbon nucleic-acid-binding protein
MIYHFFKIQINGFIKSLRMIKQVMNEATSSIIPCPECKVKNRVKQFRPDKIPLCAKCGVKLVSKEENDTQVWFSKSLKNISSIPDPECLGEQK